ncbi:hypothetical protein PHMEG_00017545 [Phytophthora megakarya]|uniref:Uncharacterized protein n=1 Tax=Phytophthora megakarya TaxID=4795 RepID=A0A225VY61_9STRA|nr:hypothetical protein PHMEG_00017545 [Phytophthora megakarya]
MPLVPTMPSRQYFAPDHICIPGRQQTRQYNIADVDPWVIQRINTLTIMTMALEVLFRALRFRPEWIFPSHLPRVATPRSGQYFGHLITGQNPMSFEITVDGRLGFLIVGYSAMEFQSFNRLLGVNPSFSSFVSIDLQRSIFGHILRGEEEPSVACGRQILRLFLIAMRKGWCDLDLLLDPYFLHFPKRTDEVAWYPGIEARSANIADPQLNCREPADLIEPLAESVTYHYRLHHAGHPARRIARLASKFFNMAALNPNAPPLDPQP